MMGMNRTLSFWVLCCCVVVLLKCCVLPVRFDHFEQVVWSAAFRECESMNEKKMLVA
jgi:hypothetical protein